MIIDHSYLCIHYRVVRFLPHYSSHLLVGEDNHYNFICLLCNMNIHRYIDRSGTSTTLLIGLATLLLFGIGGVLIIEFVQEKPILEVLEEGQPVWAQLMVGVSTGLLAIFIALYIITRKFFNSEKEYYFDLFTRWNLSYTRMVFISLCAGIGEELFFRGGVQPLLGIWWTSILFVLLHGYLNPRNWRITIYGTVMVFIIAGFGYLFETIGIFSAMTAHAVLDMGLFLYIARLKQLRLAER